MSDSNDRQAVELEVLKRYGAKWAVLAAMTASMVKKGIDPGRGVLDQLRILHGKIESGCFSPCDVGCELSQVEAQLFSYGDRLSQEEFQEWSDLSAEATQGKLDYQRILGIPALVVVKNECRFLGCTCS